MPVSQEAPISRPCFLAPPAPSLLQAAQTGRLLRLHVKTSSTRGCSRGHFAQHRITYTLSF